MNIFEFNDKYLIRPVVNYHYFDGTDSTLMYPKPLCIPVIVCKDGWSVSVQTSANHYCHPRTSEGPWTHVEVGFPTTWEDELDEYQDGNTDVYAWVPINLMLELFEKHGGIDDKKTLTWRDI